MGVEGDAGLEVVSGYVDEDVANEGGEEGMEARCGVRTRQLGDKEGTHIWT